MSGEVAYLAGPMTGHDDYNYPAFFEAQIMLENMGFIVQNPASNYGQNQNLDHTRYLRMAIGQVMCCDCIVLLPGWSKSKGAVAETAVAQMLGLTIWEVRYSPDSLKLRRINPVIKIKEVTYA